jgi:thiol:disulfide interchange protein DsbD
MTGPGVNWQSYSDQIIANAVKHHKPVIIDFSAAWCASCRELDEVTFHNPDIVRLSKSDVIMVKVDLTRKGNPLHERLVKHFEIKGVDPSGKERRDLRLVDFLPPDKFLIRMAEINKTSKSDF